MKILHAREIYTGIEVIQQTLKTTYEQVSEIEHAVEGIIQLEDSLKGKGGEAIRAFFNTYISLSSYIFKHSLPIMIQF
ncbi:LXG domain-containing protein [Bacillus aquiflavi]|nr:T7SS effector LXG polymorphic toxin [Bacillus aquiflavi]UAC48639.1 LXG domain-containing protein [Bacillus aquiflavi]